MNNLGLYPFYNPLVKIADNKANNKTESQFWTNISPYLMPTGIGAGLGGLAGLGWAVLKKKDLKDALKASLIGAILGGIGGAAVYGGVSFYKSRTTPRRLPPPVKESVGPPMTPQPAPLPLKRSEPTVPPISYGAISQEVHNIPRPVTPMLVESPGVMMEELPSDYSSLRPRPMVGQQTIPPLRVPVSLVEEMAADVIRRYSPPQTELPSPVIGDTRYQRAVESAMQEFNRRFPMFPPGTDFTIYDVLPPR